MIFTDWSQQRIRDIVTTLPVAAELFRKNGIDFCCQGDQILADAVKKLELTQKELYLALDEVRVKAAERAGEAPGLQEMTPYELASYIIDHCHPALWKRLPQTRLLLTEALRAHGKDHPELYDIYKTFGKLSSELEPHLIRDETEFLPLAARDAVPCQERCALLKHVMMEDHRKLTELMKEIRHATNGFSAPGTASEIYLNLYDSLMDLEDELYKYIHIENNLLFDKLA